MTELKTCATCKLELEKNKFPDARNICTRCKNAQKEASCSKDYVKYLKVLYSNSKSKATSGQRTHIREFTITHADLVNMWESQQGRCAISGVILTHHKDGSGTKEFNASIDRVSNSQGYTPNNIQLVCYRTNLLKHTLTEDMFYWWVKTIHDFSCD